MEKENFCAKLGKYHWFFSLFESLKCVLACMMFESLNCVLADMMFITNSQQVVMIGCSDCLSLSQVMLDTVGPELQVVNKSGQAISLKEDGFVTLTPNQEKDASSEVLPVNYSGLAKVSG